MNGSSVYPLRKPIAGGDKRPMMGLRITSAHPRCIKSKRQAACHEHEESRRPEGGSRPGEEPVSGEPQVHRSPLKLGPTFPFEKLREAHTTMDENRAAGKIVMEVV